MFDPTVPHGWHYYWKSWELPPFSDEAIDVLVEHAAALTSPLSYCIIFQLGGALSRVGENDTAFSHRNAAHNVNNAVWPRTTRRRSGTSNGRATSSPRSSRWLPAGSTSTSSATRARTGSGPPTAMRSTSGSWR